MPLVERVLDASFTRELSTRAIPPLAGHKLPKTRPAGGKGEAMERSMKISRKQFGKLRRSLPKTGCFVYGLKCPHTDEVKYVGQTRCIPTTRMRFHYRKIMQTTMVGRRLSPVQAWIKSLLDDNLKPIIYIIEERGTWDVTEAVWIDRLTREGVVLLNVSSRVP